MCVGGGGGGRGGGCMVVCVCVYINMYKYCLLGDCVYGRTLYLKFCLLICM